MHFFGGYRHFQEKVVHLYTECLEGKLIGIARRDSVNIADPAVMEGLEPCTWCFEKAAGDNPQLHAYRVGNPITPHPYERGEETSE